MKNLIFITNSNSELGKQIAEKAGLQVGLVDILRSADGEVLIRLKESVDGKSVCVLGSSFPPAENLLELLILINTLKTNGAKKVTAIIPYYGYAKADRTDRPGWSVTARLVAQFIETAGADEFVGVTLHSEKVEDFFEIPVRHLDAISLLADYFKNFDRKNLAIASPDLGGVKRAEKFAGVLGISEVLTIEKKRPTEKTVIASKIRGNPKGKNIIIVDDMIQSGNTIIEAVKALKAEGALDVYVAVSHLVYTGGSTDRLGELEIKEIITTDTVPPSDNLPPKFKIISVAELIGNYLVQI